MYEIRKASNDFKFQMEEELRKSEDADRRKKEKSAWPLWPCRLLRQPPTRQRPRPFPMANSRFQVPIPKRASIRGSPRRLSRR